MSFVFEALNAAEGDCLLLHHGPAGARRHVVIDGGPRATWSCSLNPRLEELRAEHGLDAGAPLLLELLVVTHIDNDHIQGVEAMLEDLSRCSGVKPWKIGSLWCNTFDAKCTTDDLAPIRELNEGGAAGVAEARSVHDMAVPLGIPLNGPERYFPSGFVVRPASCAPQIPLGDLRLTVLSPTEEELTKLLADWDKWIKAQRAKKATGGGASTRKDTSRPNLSSIILLAEADGRRVLLPGDAGADQILKGLEAAGLLPEGGTCEFDVIKLAHHGSIRNASKDLFERVRAKRYVISANGSDGNPDLATLKLLRGARRSDDWEIWVTFARDAWKEVDGRKKEDKERIAALKAAQRWLDHQKVKVVYREPDALGIVIPLGTRAARPAAKRRPRTARTHRSVPA
jgi:hypothetical protein